MSMSLRYRGSRFLDMNMHLFFEGTMTEEGYNLDLKLCSSRCHKFCSILPDPIDHSLLNDPIPSRTAFRQPTRPQLLHLRPFSSGRPKMFGVIREFQSPMGVTHAVRGRFGPTPTSLAVIFARKNSLDTYIVRANSEIARLELLQSISLGANVISMAVLRRGNADLLCVAFDRLRVAIMSWDSDIRDWLTEQLVDFGVCLGGKLCSPISITRNLDPEDYGKPLLRGTVGEFGEPLLRADPSGRCFAVLARKHNAIYVGPVRAEDDSSRVEERVVAKDDVFLIDLPTDYETSNVKDFVFLHGSFEPNILILLEPKRTWSGRTAVQRNTCQLLNLSVDIRLKKHVRSWAMDQLPYDAQKLEAVPESGGGGALVLSTSVIMQVRHGACTAGLTLNCYGDAYSAEMKGKYDAITTSDTLLECDAAHCRFLDFEERVADSAHSGAQCIALLSLKGGELYFLSVAIGSRNVISMKRAGSTVIASEIVPINDRFFVLASRLSDSLLIEYQKAIEAPARSDNISEGRNESQAGATSDANTSTTKKKKKRRTADEEAEYEMMFGVKPPPESSDEESGDEEGGKQSALELQDKDEGTRGVYDDEDELGWVFNSGTDSNAGGGEGGSSGKWALKVKDTLTCFGPGADLAVGPSPDDVTNTKLDMVIAGGYAKNGCLAVVHQSIRPTNRTEFEVPACEGVWTLLDPDVTKREREERKQRNAVAFLRNTACRARNAEKQVARRQFVEEAVTRIRKVAEATKQEDVVFNNSSGAEHSQVTKANQPKGLESSTEAKNTGQHEGFLNESCLDGGTALAQPDEGMQQSADDLGETADDVESADPPTKRLKLCEEEDLSPQIISDANGIHERLMEITPEVIVDLEQQAEIEFPYETEEVLEEELAEGSVLHSYMLLSTSAGTTALRTGTDIEELMDNSVEFITTERTVTAGNVMNNHAIIQVVPSRVRVLKCGRSQCEFTMSESTTIVFAQISDPFVLLQTSDNHVVVLAVKADESHIVEEDEDPDQKLSAGMQEDQFDEYGMALSSADPSFSSNQRKIAKEDNSDDGTKEPPVGQKTDVTSYKNFSLSMEYSTLESVSSEETITSSFLYKGPIANEVAGDGILSQKEVAFGDQEVPKEINRDASANDEEMTGPSPVENDKNGLAKDESKEDQFADEDRMLYGDDKNLDEEDMMLYGSGGGDNNEAKKESASGVHEILENGIKGSSEGIAATPAQSKGANERKPGLAIHSEKGVLPLAIAADVGRDDQHLLALVMSTGALKLLSPPLKWQVVLEHPLFFVGPSVIEDQPISESDHKQAYLRAPKDLALDSIAMMNLPGSALVPGLSTPILVAMSKTGMILIYRAFLSSGSKSIHMRRSRLALHRTSFRDRTAHIVARSMNCAQKGDSPEADEEEIDNSSPSAPLIPFANIAGRGGLFFGGACPFFLFAERGYPRIHPLSHINANGDIISKEEYEHGQRIVGFAEFHNFKCPRGFVIVDSDGIVRIGELSPPSVMNYDAPTPMRKVPLRCTPHKVAYHAGSATYGVLASMPTLTTREERLARILQSLEKHDKRHYQHTAAQAEAETGDEKAKRVPPLFEELHELRVYRPDTWELIKSYKLQKGEVGLALANMKVDVFKQRIAGSGAEIPSSKKGDDGNESAFASSLRLRPKDMLVVGTGYLNGEDASSRGRLLLFEISRQEVYTEEGGVFTAFQLQLIAEKELFSPVTAVASMEGYVIAGVGPQISVYKLVGDEIVHLSFAFGQLYCASIASLKQYVVAADMCKSVSFMYFRERNNSVNFLGKDYEHVTSYAAEFLLEHENMSIIVSDRKANVQLMNYAHASVPESRGGKRLLINGGTRFGSRINKFVRVRTPDRKQDIEAGKAGNKAGTHCLVFTTLDGGIGAVVAVTEVEFRKLSELKERIVNLEGIVRYGGVNPEEQTAFRPEAVSTVLLEQRLLDSRVMFDVFGTTLIEQRMLAREGNGRLDEVARVMATLDGVLYRF